MCWAVERRTTQYLRSLSTVSMRMAVWPMAWASRKATSSSTTITGATCLPTCEARTLSKFGYEGWYGDDVEPFQGPWSQPKFAFDNLLTLAQDAPSNENGVMYNPATGQQQLWNWDAASRTFGLFVEDTWKARRNLTVTVGIAV